MLLTIDASNRIGERAALRAMFEARKRVFVDLLKWDIPVIDDRFEVDQFDDIHARYILLVDAAGRHLASARLLPTDRPAILDTLFPELCTGPVPSGEHIFEITRFCLSPDIRAAERRICRNKLVTALAMFARDNAIDTYTGVAEMGWLQQILAFGWNAAQLGDLRNYGSMTLGALRIDIAGDTLTRLADAGIYADPTADLPVTRAA